MGLTKQFIFYCPPPVKTMATQSIPIVKRTISEAVDSEALPYKCSKLTFCLGAGRQVCGCAQIEELGEQDAAVVYHIDSSSYILLQKNIIESSCCLDRMT